MDERAQEAARGTALALVWRWFGDAAALRALAHLDGAGSCTPTLNREVDSAPLVDLQAQLMVIIGWQEERYRRKPLMHVSGSFGGFPSMARLPRSLAQQLRLCNGRTRLDPETMLYRGTALSDHVLQLGNRAQHIIRVSSAAREVRDEKGKHGANAVLETVGFFTSRESQDSPLRKTSRDSEISECLLAEQLARNQLLGPQPKFVLHRSSS
ncbi:hypothetical protein PVAR5_2926 [Paecilomyces variotii No. 5]|uniref:Uncharacterized protein n=1 Tax=Byssochlamys spectabilis (strain No. 5 / NBRC 109023) TaxID=1356009 RepID=V5G085_BYSSN|nr:hypothetical protein PVAR5_2926 [Paecilomyces variotii No. 5]